LRREHDPKAGLHQKEQKMRWLSGVREKWLAWVHDHSGVAAVFTAVIIAVLLGFAAMVIDVGHVMVARGELQNAADSAALAGARGYFPNSPPAGPLTPDCDAAKAAAVNYVNQNYADTLALQIDSVNDIKTGVWNWGSPGSFVEKTQTDLNSFKPSGSTVLAIQVTVRKAPGASNNNPVAMSLASLFGVTEMNVQAAAVAVNDLPLGSNPFCGTFIFAIPDCLANAACGASDKKYTVKFSNDFNDTSGWASFTQNPNANDLKCLADSIGGPCGVKLAGGCDSSSYCQPPERVKCPGCTPVYVQNGVDASVIMALRDALQAYTEVCHKPLELLIPVVAGGAGTDCTGGGGTDCTGVKWTGTKCTVGYAKIVIDGTLPLTDPNQGHVNASSDDKKWYPLGNSGIANEIKGYIICPGDWGEGIPSGNADDYYGTVSLVPKLVR
jgi:Flp pilus assembly protein TadG